jgi:hypothetical protein
LVCEAVDIAAPSQISSSPPPPAPMVPRVDGATPGVARTMGPNTRIGPGNTLTPAPSQQHGRSEDHKGPGQSDVDIEEAAVEERCMEDIPDFEEDVSGSLASC